VVARVGVGDGRDFETGRWDELTLRRDMEMSLHRQQNADRVERDCFSCCCLGIYFEKNARRGMILRKSDKDEVLVLALILRKNDKDGDGNHVV
jgi:hypothetical protein